MSHRFSSKHDFVKLRTHLACTGVRDSRTRAHDKYIWSPADSVGSRIEHSRLITAAVSKVVTRCLHTTLLPTISELSRTPQRVSYLSRRMVRLHSQRTTARDILFPRIWPHLKLESTPLLFFRKRRSTTFRLICIQSPTPVSLTGTQSTLIIATGKPEPSRPAQLSVIWLRVGLRPLTRRFFVKKPKETGSKRSAKEKSWPASRP